MSTLITLETFSTKCELKLLQSVPLTDSYGNIPHMVKVESYELFDANQLGDYVRYLQLVLSSMTPRPIELPAPFTYKDVLIIYLPETNRFYFVVERRTYTYPSRSECFGMIDYLDELGKLL